MLHATIPDGSCLFRALSYCLFKTEEYHYEIRSLLIRFENINQDIFAKHLPLGQAMKDHIKKICFPSSWGTVLEILDATSYYKIPAYFCCIDNRTKEWIWCCIKPLVANFSIPIVVDCSLPTVPAEINHFELVYWNNTHYDCSISQDTGGISTVPPIIEKKDTVMEEII